MNGPLTRLAIAVIAVLAVGCGDAAGTATGFCRRFISLIDDVAAGNVSEQEFESRLHEMGQPGGVLGARADELREAVRSGTTQEAILLTQEIEDMCWGVLDR